MFGKRGDAEYYTILFEVILGIVIAFFLIFIPAYTFLNDYVSNEYFEKTYIALDLGLLTNTVIASPNDLIYNYPHSIKYNFEIKKNIIRIFKRLNLAIIGGLSEAYYVDSTLSGTYYEEISPFIDYINDEAHGVDPIRLAIIKTENSLRFYNLNQELVENE